MNFIDIHSHQEKENTVLNHFAFDDINTKRQFSIGIHPWYCDNLETQKVSLTQKIQLENCIAIGECGLDRKCDTDFEVQKEVFEFQLELAIKYNKPVIIHCVKAYETLIPYLKQHENLTFIIHGFNQKLTILKELNKLDNVYLSFGQDLLEDRSNAEKALYDLDSNKLFFETDDATDIDITDVYLRASEILLLPIIELQNIIKTNYKKIF